MHLIRTIRIIREIRAITLFTFEKITTIITVVLGNSITFIVVLGITIYWFCNKPAGGTHHLHGFN